jgi:hypothetical protein
MIHEKAQKVISLEMEQALPLPKAPGINLEEVIPLFFGFWER